MRRQSIYRVRLRRNRSRINRFTRLHRATLLCGNAARRKRGIGSQYLIVGHSNQAAERRHSTIRRVCQGRVGAVVPNRILAIIKTQRLDAIERVGIAGAVVRHRQSTGLDRHRVVREATAEDRDVGIRTPSENVAAFTADQNVVASIAGHRVIAAATADEVVTITALENVVAVAAVKGVVPGFTVNPRTKRITGAEYLGRIQCAGAGRIHRQAELLWLTIDIIPTGIDVVA